jgi:hypothetical protein
MRPFCPRTASLTFGEEGSMVIVIGHLSATSLQEFAPFAPRASNGFILSRNISKTIRVKPFLIKLAAIGLPIAPNPIKPIFSIRTPPNKKWPRKETLLIHYGMLFIPSNSDHGGQMIFALSFIFRMLDGL